MNRKMIILAIVALALVSLACSININLPITTVKTGPTVTENINVPFLAEKQATADVTLNFGAGKLNLQPGATNELISGTATYNVTDFKPVVTIDSNNINIEQGNLKMIGIPIFENIINDWNFSFGVSPMSLAIKAGAYTGDFELGGLSIHRLEVTDGASKVNLSFSKHNLVEMATLKYTTGASQVTLTGLGNANVTDLSFSGGAGNYTLEFSGQLNRNMTVSIDAGVSTVTVIVPAGVPAQLTTDGSLITVNTSGGWEQTGNTYQLSGSGYTITILAKMGAGSLKLETSRQGIK
ncbi:MAG: toast rack family protein [Anaerolineales bacterium]